MSFLTVTSKYRITIPREIRQRLDIRPGQKVQFILDNGHVTIVPVKSENLPGENNRKTDTSLTPPGDYR